MNRSGEEPSAPAADRRRPGGGVRHEAWLYADSEEFAAGAGSFAREGLEAGEAVLVATTPDNLRALEGELGPDAASLQLTDITEAGRNPGRVLSMWHEFVRHEGARGRPARGIGEPVWAGRTAAELDECCRHEALVNDGPFGCGGGFWLLCSYHSGSLDRATLDTAESTHPYVHEDGRLHPSRGFDSGLGARALDGELPPPQEPDLRFSFDRDLLGEMRVRVGSAARLSGLDAHRTDGLVLAANELATNEVRHGGGRGEIAVWERDNELRCQVEGSGRIADPLIGRTKPAPDQPDGRGMWLVHELCDLVRVRSSERGTTVRVSMRTASP